MFHGTGIFTYELIFGLQGTTLPETKILHPENRASPEKKFHPLTIDLQQRTILLGG